MNVLIREIPDAVNARIDAAAEAAGLSKQELLLDLLTKTYAEPPLVIGWVKFDHAGKKYDTGVCPECGEVMEDLYAGLLSNGKWVAPRCKWCATEKQ